MIRFHATDVKLQGRNTMGVRIVDLDADDKVGSLARVDAEQTPAATALAGTAMLDIRLLRENPEAVERGLRDRGGAELVREDRRPRTPSGGGSSPRRKPSRPSATAPRKPSVRPSAAARIPRP